MTSLLLLSDHFFSFLIRITFGSWILDESLLNPIMRQYVDIEEKWN
jgi:hypothetical protein